MNKTALLILTFVTVGVNSIRAAEEIVHTVNFPKGDAAWTVDFKVEKAAPTPKPTPAITEKSPPPPPRQKKKVEIVRQGNLRHDIVTWSDGSTTEFWWIQKAGLIVYQDVPDGRINILKTGNLPDQLNDGSLFTWVNAGTFVDKRQFQGKKCRYYETEITLPTLEKLTLRAWIDNETQKPAAWSNSGILSLFTFDNPLPAEPLVLPDKFQKVAERILSFSFFQRKPVAR